MKTLSFIILISFFPSFLSADSQSSVQQLLTEGNKLYEEGKYEQAIEKYKNIISSGIHNGYIYYNLGNCYFKTGRIGYSILYYEKALKLIPRDAELIHNLKFVKNLTQDKVVAKKPSFLFFITIQLLNRFSLKEIVSIVSLLFSLTGLFAIFFILQSNIQILKNVTISFLVIFVFSAFLLSLKIKIINKKMGVVTTKVVDVLSAPSQDATLEFTIHEGTELDIIQQLGGWVKVKLLDGKTGWVPENSFSQI
ncbi:MAG: hypothetical protein B5M53_08225 [Candidatus Cloacimonas sp. 4484_209]|nr:MAG: hypothetical protein B5M53_08225 [Candidatus Cloacimonas sp. 4484_209]